MSIQAVLFHRDGRVEHLVLEKEVPVYSVPILPDFQPFHEFPPTVSFQRDDYRIGGRMFDGRPVYVLDEYEVREARCIWISPLHLASEADEENKRAVHNLVAEVRGWILDEWCGAWPVPKHEAEELAAQHLVKRGARLLAVYRKADSDVPPGLYQVTWTTGGTAFLVAAAFALARWAL